MAMRVGILTAGGDCPGLNATIRGVAKALYQKLDDVEILWFRFRMVAPLVLHGSYPTAK